MAIDEWLLDQHRQSAMPSVLRFYTWNPPAISLGYHQTQWPNHWNQLTWQNKSIDVVKRPTGGRAVLHAGDLTYAIITSGLQGRRMQVYQTLCQFLIDGWRSLSTPLYYGHKTRNYHHNPNCFETATVADLVTESGVKFIGSAQLRRQGAILQHGSMQLQPDPELYQQVFGLSSPNPSTPSPNHTSIRQDIPQIMDALTQAAQANFNMELCVQPISEHEWAAIADYHDRYRLQPRCLIQGD
ncbi:MAG: biotin/lipoate A/B protein ligase family protein [Cyanobacteria bacterium J06627_8]